ncbi:MAG: LLM class flavin-dependent oxidoreductase [Candidatus Bathyarchaeia archaeon]
MVKFGCRVVGSVEDIVNQTLLAERAGFESVWLPDHIAVLPVRACPDPFLALTAAGLRTKLLKLAPAVTDPFRRHPAIIAQTMATMDNILGGRAILGIGAGEPMNLVPYGIEWQGGKDAVERLREAITCIKLLWASEPRKMVDYAGSFYRLRNAYLTIKCFQTPHPPIYIGALGAKTRQLAGEIGDGWYPYIVSMQSYTQGLRDLEEGARRSGRNPKEIDAVVRICSAVSNDQAAARRAVEKAARIRLLYERRILKEMGYGTNIPEELSIHRVLPTGETMLRIEAALSQIPMDAVGAVSVYGTPRDCVSKLEEWVEAGAEHIVIDNVGPDPEEALRLYGEKIIPRFTERRNTVEY